MTKIAALQYVIVTKTSRIAIDPISRIGFDSLMIRNIESTNNAMKINLNLKVA